MKYERQTAPLDSWRGEDTALVTEKLLLVLSLESLGRDSPSFRKPLAHHDRDLLSNDRRRGGFDKLRVTEAESETGVGRVMQTTAASNGCSDTKRHSHEEIEERMGARLGTRVLELSDADMAYIETKRALAACLREQRMKRHLTQTELAARLETSQSRVAKMESGDSTVSIDLLLQALYRIGTKRRQLAALL